MNIRKQLLQAINEAVEAASEAGTVEVKVTLEFVIKKETESKEETA